MEINRRRSSVEVIGDILRLGEAGKTEIMYGANMSYRQLQRYLAFLIQDGFLERRMAPNPGVKYQPTQKGQRLLRSIDTLLDILGAQG